MNKFKKFGEFAESKKKQDLLDAKDGLAGEDYDGPLATKPPQEPTKGKNDKPLPYKASGEEEKGVVWTAPDGESKKGLATHGTPGITPQTSSLGTNVEDKTKQRPKPKRMTTEQFITHTKDMKNTEFMNYILETHNSGISTVTDLFGNEFTPDPQQSIEYVAGLMLGNPFFMEKFIREVKRRGGMSDLMEELFQHGDSYELIVDHLGHPDLGELRSGKMAKVMNEKYMKNFEGFDFPEEDDVKEEGVAPPLNMGPMADPRRQGGSIGGGSGPDGTPDPNYTRSSSYSSDGGQSNPMGSAGAGRNPSATQAFDASKLQMPMPVKKMSADEHWNGPHAAGHLMNEFAKYKGFKRHMAGLCKNGEC